MASSKHFEDFKAGDRFVSNAYEVSEESIITFAREWDPQAFHLGAAKAERSILKGL